MTNPLTTLKYALTVFTDRLTMLMHKVFILDILSKATSHWGKPYLLYDDKAALPKHRKTMANATTVDMDSVLQGQITIPKDKPVVLYCTSINDQKAEKLIKSLSTEKIAMYRPTALLHRIHARLHKDKKETGSYSDTPLLTNQSNRILYLYEGKGIETATSISPWFIAIILTLLMASANLNNTFVPTDDLARHAKVFQHQYDYTSTYPYAYNPPFNIYLGFDIAIGIFYRVIGNNASLIFQLLPFFLLTAALIKLTKPAPQNTQSIAILIVFFFIWQRLQSGRPCILQTSIMLLTLAYNDQLKSYAHFAIGLIQAFFYHLFFLYTIPMMLTGKKRFRDYAISTACGLAWWTAYSKNHYIPFLKQIATTMSKSGLVYNEQNPIFSVNLISYLLPLAPLLYYFRRDIKRTLIIGFFALTNQARYIETIIPIAVSFLKFSKVRITSLTVLIAMSLVLYTFHSAPYKEVHIPPDSYVLTTGSALMNAVVMGSDNVHIVPTYNLPWNDQAIIQTILNMHKGNMDCSIFKTYHFDYVVENTLEQPPACLSLQNIQGGYRIWKVIPDKKQPGDNTEFTQATNKSTNPTTSQ